MTIHHVVLFRFHDGTSPHQGEALADALSRLPTRIPQIGRYRVGTDLGLNEGNWDLAVAAEFETPEDFVAYRDHPDHRAVITTLVEPITAERHAVQFLA